MLENCEVISSVQKNNIKINKIMTELWYYKQYNNLIDKCIQMESEGYSEDVYTEVHHILPKCMGGTNKKDNLVRMPVRYHIFAHIFLMKAFPNNNKLVYAANRMLSCNGNSLINREPIIKKFSTILISMIRKEVSIKTSERVSGENHPLFGTHHSEETRNKIRKARLETKMPPASEELRKKRSENAKGEKNGMYGKHPSEETKRKILELRKQGKAGHFSKVQGPDGTVYKSVKDAAEALGVDRHKITDLAKRHPESGWKYYKE